MLSRKQPGIIEDQLGQAIDRCPDFRPVPVIVVHDDPLRMPQRGDLPYPFKPRIVIAGKTGKYRQAGPGKHQVPQRSRPIDSDGDLGRPMVVGISEVGRDGRLLRDRQPPIGCRRFGAASPLEGIGNVATARRRQILLLRLKRANADIAFSVGQRGALFRDNHVDAKAIFCSSQR